MKIPQIFIPEKCLEKKICDLTKSHKIFKHEEPVRSSVHDTINKAERIATKLGKYHYSGYNVFKDKKTGLIIKYWFPSYPDANETLTVYQKKGLFKKEKILKFSREYRETVSVYIPGEWEKSLEELYNLTVQK